MSRIVEYTMYEGDYWLQWPFEKPAFVPSEDELTFLRKNRRSIGQVEIRGIWLHCFKTDFGHIWDEINGWRERDGTSKN